MDKVSKSTRSEIMRKVKKADTKLEQNVKLLLAQLVDMDFRYQANELPGKPDFAFDATKVAVFIDSCFWHACPTHVRIPKSNSKYWVDKINKNKLRDKANRYKLNKIGWKSIRLWEHELNSMWRLKRKLGRLLPLKRLTQKSL